LWLANIFKHFFSGYDQYWDVQYRNGRWNDNFIFKIGVEITDHPLTTHLSSFPVNVALKVGNLIMQGNVYIHSIATNSSYDILIWHFV
jgi:hypothetical protein